MPSPSPHPRDPLHGITLATIVTKLVEKLGGTVAGLAVIVELEFLPGREKLAGYDVFSLLRYQS